MHSPRSCSVSTSSASTGCSLCPTPRCAVAANTEQQLRQQVSDASGQDASWQSFEVVADQLAALREDVQKVRSHPLVPEAVVVGGFLYDVDTGLLEQHV